MENENNQAVKQTQTMPANLSHGTPAKRNYRSRAKVEGYSEPRGFSSNAGFVQEIFVKENGKEKLIFTIIASDVEEGRRSVQIFEGKPLQGEPVFEYTDGGWHTPNVSAEGTDAFTHQTEEDCSDMSEMLNILNAGVQRGTNTLDEENFVVVEPSSLLEQEAER